MIATTLTKEAEDVLLQLADGRCPQISGHVAHELGEPKLASRDLRAEPYATPAGLVVCAYIRKVRGA